MYTGQFSHDEKLAIPAVVSTNVNGYGDYMIPAGRWNLRTSIQRHMAVLFDL